jgi:hypothetical protein
MSGYMMNFDQGAKVLDDTPMEGTGGGLLRNGEVIADSHAEEYAIYYECSEDGYPDAIDHPAFAMRMRELGYTHFRTFDDYDAIPVTYRVYDLNDYIDDEE